MLQLCLCAAGCQSLICSSLPVPDCDILRADRSLQWLSPSTVASLWWVLSQRSWTRKPAMTPPPVRQLPTRSPACSVITGDPWAWGPGRKDGRFGKLLFLELNLKSSHLRVSCYSNPHPYHLTTTNYPFFQFCFKCRQLPEAFPDVFGLIRDLKSPYQDFLSLAFY